MTIKIKADEELFNQWQKVGRIVANLASIVQNDMEIEAEELAEWHGSYYASVDELKEVFQETMAQLRANNGPGFSLRLFRVEARLALEKEQES